MSASGMRAAKGRKMVRDWMLVSLYLAVEAGDMEVVEDVLRLTLLAIAMDLAQTYSSMQEVS